MDNLNYVKNEESLADKAQQRKNRMSAKAIERDMEN
jgi:ppGpp synthetase/RelA/SpoT-type nucleotidyltranferase